MSSDKPLLNHFDFKLPHIVLNLIEFLPDRSAGCNRLHGHDLGLWLYRAYCFLAARAAHLRLVKLSKRALSPHDLQVIYYRTVVMPALLSRPLILRVWYRTSVGKSSASFKQALSLGLQSLIEGFGMPLGLFLSSTGITG